MAENEAPPIAATDAAKRQLIEAAVTEVSATENVKRIYRLPNEPSKPAKGTVLVTQKEIKKEQPQ